MLDRPAGTIAVAALQAPPIVQHRAPGVVWCRTVPELVVLGRAGRLHAIVIDHAVGGLSLDRVASFTAWSIVVIVVDDRPARPRWEGVGAVVLREVPPDTESLEVALGVAQRAARLIPDREFASHRGALVTVLEAAGGGGAEAASALARALATDGSASGPVVLADLTLDGLHRPRYGLGPDQAGLPELLDACRFGLPSVGEVHAALHRVAPGLLVLPGLRHHREWVSVGWHAATVALEAIRGASAVVVAQVDRDLEGEADTGSFDIEDRNILARATVRAADLVVVSGRSGPEGHVGLLAALASLAAFGVPPERTLALATGRVPVSRRWRRADLRPSERLLHRSDGDRIDLRLGHAVQTHLAALGAGLGAPVPSAAPEPQQVAPGALGHWAHDIEGWITPRVPQQP